MVSIDIDNAALIRELQESKTWQTKGYGFRMNFEIATPEFMKALAFCDQQAEERLLTRTRYWGLHIPAGETVYAHSHAAPFVVYYPDSCRLGWNPGALVERLQAGDWKFIAAGREHFVPMSTRDRYTVVGEYKQSDG